MYPSESVLVAAATQPTKMHLGVYATEIEAARAYDRALISALGLEAASLLNFPLLDYLDQLGEKHVDSLRASGNRAAC